MIKKCEFCFKEFTTRDSRKRFCDKTCSNKSRKKEKVLCNCLNCGKVTERFPSQVSENTFCSKECNKEYLTINNSIEFNCEVCNRVKRISKSDYNQSKHHYCSYECSKKGFSKNYSDKNNPNYKKMSIKCDCCNTIFLRKPSDVNEKLNFCSVQCKNQWQSDNIKGELHPNFNPNITKKEREVRRNFSEYWKWRKEVYNRDGYRCVKCCDNKGGNLNAHHIFNYSSNVELRVDISNGITLCNKCHKEFHKTYGNKNNNKTQIDEFLIC